MHAHTRTHTQRLELARAREHTHTHTHAPVAYQGNEGLRQVFVVFVWRLSNAN